MTVAITSERITAFKRANKAWKDLLIKCQEVADDFGKRPIDMPLFGFMDAQRKKSGPHGKHIKVINKFFQQYAKYVKYRTKWKEEVLGKTTDEGVEVELRPQLSFQADEDSESSGEDSESAEESANSDEESENSDGESAKKDAEPSENSDGESAKRDAEPELAPYKSDAARATVESEKSDSSSSERSEESGEEQSPKAAAKKKSPKKMAVLLPNVHGKKQDQLFEKAKKKRVEYEEIDGIEIDVDEITLADGSKMNLAEDGTLYNMNDEEVGTWDEETNTLKSLRRTPKPKTKRGHDEIETDNSDNKRASNKKKKKRRKKHKKSKGSASGATP